ncbi:MAG: EamA family transporter [Candidatus Binatota bacterium]|nr:EamA family transporter [Candidatus Binatota bacterium]
MNLHANAAAQHDPSPVLIWTALSAVYLIWGSTYLAIRFTVETFPPFLSAAARFIISGAVLYLCRRLCGDAAPSRYEWRSATVIGILLLVGGNGAVVWAARYIPSSLAALLVATCPLWMLLFDFLRPGGGKPGPQALLGILIGFGGAVLLIGWSANGTTPNSFVGAVVVVFGSLFWAAGSIYGKTAKLPSSPLLITGMEMLSGGAALLIIALVIGELGSFDVAQVSSRSTIGWIYLTVIGPIAFVAYAWLLRNAPIPLVSTYSYVNPLVAIILGYFLGREILAPRVLAAAGLIIGSVVLVSRRQ